MKTTTTSVLLLLFLFSTKSCLLGVTNAQNQTVLDMDGDELRPGVAYYVVSSVGTGLDAGSTRRQVCPKPITASSPRNPKGQALVITPVNPRDDFIHEASDVNIQFAAAYDPYCRSSTAFQLRTWQPGTGHGLFHLGGQKGYTPKNDNLNTWFKFEKASPDVNMYKFKHCPSVCDSCVTLCGYLDMVENQGQKSLGIVKESEWNVGFVKASRPFGAIKQVDEGKESN